MWILTNFHMYLNVGYGSNFSHNKNANQCIQKSQNKLMKIWFFPRAPHQKKPFL